MSEFCREHAFYDCPVCKGESLDWVIPVVEGSDIFGRGGRVTGTVTVSPDNVVTITGTPDLPMPPQTVIVREPEIIEIAPVVSERESERSSHTTSVGRGMVRDAEGSSRSETYRRPRPSQLAEVAAMFNESLMDDPRLLRAAARGRAVYERALALAEELGIPLIEALPRAAEES